jgi:esterase
MSDPDLLSYSNFGEQVGTPLILVHGLFGSGRNWRAIARFLSKNRWVVTVDMRNHGNSFWNPQNSYFDLSSDLARLVRHLGGVADVMGHSMGGKAAMVLALNNPEMIQRLIIADIAPVGYLHSQNDKIEVMQSLLLNQFDRRSAAETALEDKLGDAGLAAFFAQSLSFDDPAPKWLLNLDALYANMDAIIGFPVLNGSFAKEVLFLCGGDSDYVDNAGKIEIDRLFPKAITQTIDGASHWIHADKPREFMTILSAYLDS